MLKLKEVARPEWLPPGWIAMVSTRKNGRVDRYYKRWSSGPIFRSKPEVMRQIEVEKIVGQETKLISWSGHSNQQMVKQVDDEATGSKCSVGAIKQKPMIHIGDSPEWLPSGWITEIRIRQGGESAGLKDKYYKSRLSGSICRSKPEVMRQIEIEKNVGQETKLISWSGRSSQQMVKKLDGQATRSKCSLGTIKHKPMIQVGDSPEWLPSGWITEFKIRQGGESAGRKDKCYINPFTGSRFFSKKEVFRYLESGEHCSRSSNKRSIIKTTLPGDICNPSNQRGNMGNKFTDNVLVQLKYSSNGLPDGWITEIKLKKTNNKHEVRKYAYYIDPVSGYAFTSQKDAFHYIETGEVSKHAFRPKKRHAGNMDSVKMEGHSPIAAKRRITQGNAVRRSLFSRQALNSKKKMVPEIAELPDKIDLPRNRHPSAQGMKGAGSRCFPPSSAENFGNDTENLDDQACLPVKEKTLNEIIAYASRKKKLYKKVPILQIGYQELQVPLNKQSEESQLQLVHEKQLQPFLYGNSHRGSKKLQGRMKRGIEEQANSQKQVSVVPLRPKRSMAFKATTVPPRSSKRLAGVEAGPVVNSRLIGRPLRAVVKKSELSATPAQGSDEGEVKPDDPEPAPMIGLEVLEKLEVEEPPKESTLMFPFGDSWTDSCLDFAFKTLTGDIKSIQDYFQQQLIHSPIPINFVEPELHVQHPVQERRACTLDYELQSGREEADGKC